MKLSLVNTLSKLDNIFRGHGCSNKEGCALLCNPCNYNWRSNLNKNIITNDLLNRYYNQFCSNNNPTALSFIKLFLKGEKL